MQKITPFLWFNDNLEQAIEFYTAIFPNSTITKTVRNTSAGPGPEGAVMTAVFNLAGQEFIALNGGPSFTFNEAVSFVVSCENQEEVDNYWEKLSQGGEKSRCGWLKDQFGLWWQVVPTALPKLMGGTDGERTKRVMQAMMKMDKIVISDLENAYNSVAAEA